MTTKMFQSEIVLESLKIGFSELDFIRFVKLYSCPNPNFEQEQEIPAHMVAMAATTVCCLILLSTVLSGIRKDYATLQHLLHDGSGGISDFSTPTLNSVFQAHMVRLIEWRHRRSRLYHKYMYKEYKVVM